MYKVMLIDDEKSLHMAIEKLLTKSGYEYCGATDAESGLEMLATEKPDLLLLDVMLPGMDGLQVLKEIRKTSKVPVIMLTAKDETFDKVLGLELGADDYMTKPFETKELVARVKAVLRRAPEGAAAETGDDTLRFPSLSLIHI